MTIQIKIKNVYGNELIYPVCTKAKLFASLANTKTFTQRALVDIIALGYSLEKV